MLRELDANSLRQMTPSVNMVATINGIGPASQAAQVSLEDDQDAEVSEDIETDDGDPPMDRPPPPPFSDADPNYVVYDTRYDEVIPAEDMMVD